MAFGLLDGVVVKLQPASVHQVGHNLLGNVGGKRFAIGQTVAHIRRPMALKEGPASVLGRAHTPLAPSTTEFVNLPFELLNHFIAID
jgi:hypothetical protein